MNPGISKVPAPHDHDTVPPMRRLADLPVRISVRLCTRSIKLKDLAAISPGVCLPLEDPSNSPLELHAGGVLLAAGEGIQKGNQLGFRLCRIQPTSSSGCDSRDHSK